MNDLKYKPFNKESTLKISKIMIPNITTILSHT